MGRTNTYLFILVILVGVRGAGTATNLIREKTQNKKDISKQSHTQTIKQ